MENQENQENQQEPTKKPNQTLLAAIIVLVIAVLGVGGYFLFATGQEGEDITNEITNTNATLAVNENVNQATNENINTTVDTSGWKTYHDAVYNFDFKYPKDWIYQVYTTGYNDEGTYVIALTTERTEIELLPLVSVRQDWSVDKETERIQSANFPGVSITTSQLQIGLYKSDIIKYRSDIGLNMQKTVITIGNYAYIFTSLQDDLEIIELIATFSKK